MGTVARWIGASELLSPSTQGPIEAVQKMREVTGGRGLRSVADLVGFLMQTSARRESAAQANLGKVQARSLRLKRGPVAAAQQPEAYG